MQQSIIPCSKHWNKRGRNTGTQTVISKTSQKNLRMNFQCTVKLSNFRKVSETYTKCVSDSFNKQRNNISSRQSFRCGHFTPGVLYLEIQTQIQALFTSTISQNNSRQLYMILQTIMTAWTKNEIYGINVFPGSVKTLLRWGGKIDYIRQLILSATFCQKLTKSVQICRNHSVPSQCRFWHTVFL